jgi:MoxR-like ATPase
MHQKIIALAQDLNANLLERETAVEAALLALLTREHLLLLGPPGTAKSMLVRSVCERITGATYFERLLTRFSTPEELFGPLSLSALEHDEYKRIIKGSIVDAHLVFVDECMKANSAILNSMLSLMNERVYHEAGAAVPAKLLSMVGASNELPEDASLGAMYDRFLVRLVVQPLADDDSLKMLLRCNATSVNATVSLVELAEAQRLVAMTPLTDDTVDGLINIKHGLEEEGVSASDRRWKACGKLLRAKAFLDGETETSADHCEVLVHSLWTEPAQIRVVERVVAKVANPLNLEAVELEDAAKDLYDQRPTIDNPQLTQALEPLLRQLGDIHSRLETKIAGVPEKKTARAKAALQKVQTWHRALSQLALQSLSRLHMAPGSVA